MFNDLLLHSIEFYGFLIDLEHMEKVLKVTAIFNIFDSQDIVKGFFMV